MYSPISTNTRRHSLATSGAPNFKFPSQHKYIETLSHSPTMVLLLDDTMKDMYDEQLRMPSSFSNRAKVDPQWSQPSDEPTTIDSDENIVSDEMVRQVNHANAISGKPSDTIHLSSSKDDFDTALERECQICFEKFDALQTQVCVICNGSFCMTCMRWYIEFKINEGEVSSKKLVCPASLCTRPLTQDLIEAFVTPEHFAKYQLFLSNQQPGIRFCPRAGCSTVIDEPLHTRTRRVMCSSCKNESCMRCGNDFHKLPTCTRNGRRFGRWKKRHNVRACPGCTTDIEKQGGCSHMKCFQCDHEFCWGCLRPWETHDENLCIPLAFFRSKNPKYGPIAPVRVMTKTVIVGAAAVVVVTGASVAVVVVPSILLFQWAKTSIQRRAHRHSNKYANDYDLV